MKKDGCRQIGRTNLKIPSGSRGLSESFLKIQCVNTRHLPHCVQQLEGEMKNLS